MGKKDRQYNVAEVSLPLPIFSTYDYLIPEHLILKAEIGKRAILPLGKKGETIGYIVSIKRGGTSRGGNSPENAPLKEIYDILDEKPLFDENLLRLFRKISNHYLYPLGEVIKTGIPSLPDPKGGKVVVLTEKGKGTMDSYPFLHLLDRKTPFSLTSIKRNHREIDLNHLRRKGLIEIKRLETKVSGKKKAFLPMYLSSQEEEEKGKEISNKFTPPLSKDKKIVEAIDRLMDSKRFITVLLSGGGFRQRCEIYFGAMEKAIAKGKGSILLVPEIGLVSSVIHHLPSYLASRTVLWHSELSQKERGSFLTALKEENALIVVGTRSAVFSPIKNLGLIIVEGESSPFFKQEDRLRYHGRDVALLRGKMESFPVILGAESPSIESSYHAKKKGQISYTLRDEGIYPPPKITVIDMRKGEEAIKDSILSYPLLKAIKERIGRQEKVLLYLNRRGFARTLICKRCGYTFICPDCSLPLVYHQKEKSLICHYCNFSRPKPNRCDRCNDFRGRFLGWGTERLEAEIKRFLPKANILRIDQDSAGGRGKEREVKEIVEKGNYQILLGTEMLRGDISGGLSHRGISLVGVVSADSIINLPDFRSGEKTYNLLSDLLSFLVAEDKNGSQMIIQTLYPFHPSIKALLKQDYQYFFKSEIKSRKRLFYPPFSRLSHLVIYGKNDDKTRRFAEKIAQEGKDLIKGNPPWQKGIEALGPSLNPWPTGKGNRAFSILIKGKRERSLYDFLHRLISLYPPTKSYGGIRITFDVDPYSLI